MKTKRILPGLIVLLICCPARAAMDANSCAAAIVTNLKTLNPEITGTAQTSLTATWVQICAALIAQIRANAQVTVIGVQGGTGTATGTVQ